MNVVIRADGSTFIGLGHIMRCLGLAHALQARGAQVLFLARSIDADVRAIVRDRGLQVTCVPGGLVVDELVDAANVSAVLRDWPAEIVVVDHYDLGAAWHRAVRQTSAVRVAAIDDLGNRAMAADWVIDANLTDDPARKFAGFVDPSARLLAGPRYALLGPHYASAPRHDPHTEVRSIGIFMGGTDAPNMTTLAHDACRRLVGFGGAIEIASTRSNPHVQALQRLTEHDSRTRLTLDQPDLAGFFARHDLQIGAGGSATWERCCIGSPTVAVLTAPNQRHVLLPLCHLDVLDVVTADPPSTEDVAQSVRALIASPSRRAAMSRASRTLVDGLGAGRVADTLLSLKP